MDYLEELNFYQVTKSLKENEKYYTSDTIVKDGKIYSTRTNIHYCGKYKSSQNETAIFLNDNFEVVTVPQNSEGKCLIKKHKYELVKKLQVGVEYYTTNSSIRINNSKYYLVKNDLQYVGKYKFTGISGIGDGVSTFECFDKDGEEVIVKCDFYNHTCFLQKQMYDLYDLQQDEIDKEYYTPDNALYIKPVVKKPVVEKKPVIKTEMCEVFRIPQVGKEYYTTIDTTKTNGKYYSPIDKLRYVGIYKYHASNGGYGDSGSHYAVFDNNGKDEIVTYDYDGKTCFFEKINVETSSPEINIETSYLKN